MKLTVVDRDCVRIVGSKEKFICFAFLFVCLLVGLLVRLTEAQSVNICDN